METFFHSETGQRFELRSSRFKQEDWLPCRHRPQFVASLNDSDGDGLELLQGVVDGEQRLRRHQLLDVLVHGLEVDPGPQFELTRSRQEIIGLKIKCS